MGKETIMRISIPIQQHLMYFETTEKVVRDVLPQTRRINDTLFYINGEPWGVYAGRFDAQQKDYSYIYLIRESDHVKGCGPSGWGSRSRRLQVIKPFMAKAYKLIEE